MRPRVFSFALLGLALTGCGLSAPPPASGPAGGGFEAARGCKHPWVFSDLGAKTLVDTSRYDFDTDTGDIDPVPGSQEYLAALGKAGFTVGLIVNVPEEWGRDDDQKIFRVIDMIDKAWTGAAPFPWGQIGKITGTGVDRHFAGRYLVPDRDAHRKPDPYLFRKAVSLARPCKTFYMSAIAEEVPAARAAGMAAYRIADHNYLPVEQIDSYVGQR
jgi:FMN phosphatase YigB (HAD superfamily)